MAEGHTLLQLDIKPVDSLFFRDARPFEPASRAASNLPMPQTLAGAVRTLLLEWHGVDFSRLREQGKNGVSFAEALAEFGPTAAAVASVRTRGPWFTLDGEVLAPAPASLRRAKAETEDCGQDRRPVYRLDPLKSPLPGWRLPASGMLPLWRYGREAVEVAVGFVKLPGLRGFLEGGLPEPSDLVREKDVYGFDDRTGIGVDAQRNTVQEGRIYAVRMLILRPAAGLYAEVSGPADALAPLANESVLMQFGGEGRHVVIHVRETGADWPCIAPDADKGRMVLLTTPAWFDGWKPPGLDPVAAAVGSGQPVSGWDLARGGPKPNRFMVPAGSVYFLPPGAKAPDELVADEDASVGWGCFLEGNWSHV